MSLPAGAQLALLCAFACGCGQLGRFEVGAQMLGAVSVDHETRGGGVGAAVELGMGVWELPKARGQVLARVRAGGLAGAGMAWLFDATGAYRLEGMEPWQPDAGVSVGVLSGDLVRTISADGERSADPVLLQLAVNPLRFRLDGGWVSGLAFKVGPPLFRAGAPPLAISMTFFEVGMTL